ncbi:MAG TPA: helix-turn-helix transcriptional regulator [Candidatus Alectryocaccomicrobium excrementavium]|uniref:Helix-turn-helix transcriptional regulator n=1 Tax=Candidatus Alectryocaccomicrobium excrementavium TaxID=2840668 RepID=A0A9D1K6T8_9FIRM|nr:helix-turn-helix transcriptional regulator [Candidatus Alectryocaccomicrobium excrementavium]
MKPDERSRIDALLCNVAAGKIAAAHHSAAAQDSVLQTEQFFPRAAGKGQAEIYSVFPGVDAAYLTFQAPEVAFRHAPSSGVLELFHCHSGRVGWNMQGGMAIYLGAGDMTVHSAACCADSTMMFPLGYVEGISLTIDPQRLAANLPEALHEANFRPQELLSAFCHGKPVAIPACPPLAGLFAPLYSARPALRGAYLHLKIQELLLYLRDLPPEQLATSRYSSQQAEWIKKIHRQLTEHLDQRFTIEALARQYLINASTLKEVFKAVYGLPIATYMKEYRMRQAMKLLRETDASIADIAAKVGYETQGKFTQAFKAAVHALPTEYRKQHGQR